MNFWGSLRFRAHRQPMSPGIMVLSHSTLVDSLYLHLSVPDVLNLQRVCFAVHQAVRKWIPSAYNADTHLRRFFDNPLSFRILQARTGTIVSGSSALQFFERSYYPGSDLDVYTPCRHTYIVAKWLYENGYVFFPTENQQESLQTMTPASLFEQISRRRISSHAGQPLPEGDVYGWSSIEAVLTFIHGDDSSRKVQVIVTDPQSTPIGGILQFHSTLVMNFIAWDKAYCLFPSATFLYRSCLTFGDVRKNTRLPHIYEKYWRRGFKISVMPIPRSTLPKPFYCGGRYVGDKHTWTINLNTEEVIHVGGGLDYDGCPYVPTKKMAGFTLLNNALESGWQEDIRRNPDRTVYRTGQPAIYYCEISSPILRSVLTIPVSPSDRFRFIKEFLQVQEEFEKLQARSLNPDINLEAGFHPDEIPEWKYWDEEVMQMVKQKM